MQRDGGCAVIRHSHLIAVVGAFLIAVVVVGCASGPGYIDERDGEGALPPPTRRPQRPREINRRPKPRKSP
jgi:hypothetical protein